MFRIPEDLHARLAREAGKRMILTARSISINRVVIEILEEYFQAQDQKRGRG